MSSEFRKDPLSGDWVLIAPGRAKRPHPEQRQRLVQTREECPFEVAKMERWHPPITAYDHGREMSWHGDWLGRWTTVVVPNDFPVVTTGMCGDSVMRGQSETYEGHGFHELVITRDHERSLADFSQDEVAEVLTAYRDRFVTIASQDCGAYIYICHNYGRAAGASVAHNHTQIFTTPMVPPAVLRALTAPVRHQEVIDWEIADGKRIVYENDSFIVLCPFTSRVPYEMKLYPKVRSARFELSDKEALDGCADALRTALKKLKIGVDDPDYNLMIHTAPAKDQTYDDSYHWNIEIMPRLTIVASFEVSTSIFVNPSDPDECAKRLRETNV